MAPVPLTRNTDTDPVAGLRLAPAAPRACLVLAHGSGAGMTHRAMAAIANELEDLGVASLRYRFPYMERGSKRVVSRHDA